MRARVRFKTVPFFTSLPNRLECPGVLVDRGEGRAMWTMVFVADKQISALVFEGDIKWAMAPVEQDFGKGIRFKLMSRPGNKRRLDGVEHDPPKHDPNHDPNHDPHNGGKGKNPAKAAAQAKADKADKDKQAKPDKPPKPDHPHKPHDPDAVNDDLPLLRAKNFGTRPPVAGIFAEGVLLG